MLTIHFLHDYLWKLYVFVNCNRIIFWWLNFLNRMLNRNNPWNWLSPTGIFCVSYRFQYITCGYQLTNTKTWHLFYFKLSFISFLLSMRLTMIWFWYYFNLIKLYWISDRCSCVNTNSNEILKKNIGRYVTVRQTYFDALPCVNYVQ